MGKSTKIAKKSWKMKQILSKRKKWKRKTVVASNTKCHECKLSMLFHVGRIKKRDGYEKVGWSVMMNRIKGATQHPSPTLSNFQLFHISAVVLFGVLGSAFCLSIQTDNADENKFRFYVYAMHIDETIHYIEKFGFMKFLVLLLFRFSF